MTEIINASNKGGAFQDRMSCRVSHLHTVLDMKNISEFTHSVGHEKH